MSSCASVVCRCPLQVAVVVRLSALVITAALSPRDSNATLFKRMLSLDRMKFLQNYLQVIYPRDCRVLVFLSVSAMLMSCLNVKVFLCELVSMFLAVVREDLLRF